MSLQSSRRRTPRPQAIIVLGAAQYDGRPSRILRARLDEAFEQAQSFPAPPPIVTVGGKLPGDRFTEAGTGKRYLDQRYQHNQPDSSGTVIAVAQGNDTVASLRAVYEQLPYREVLIVTDPLHRLRAWLLAREQGFGATVVGARGYPTPTGAPAWWRYLAHEAGGLVVFGIEKLAGQRVAAAVRSALHRVEALIRPSRRLRHEVLRHGGLGHEVAGQEETPAD
ncbi:YdcF family protein [Corynebacterium sp.]|uniref:YdcF family protein n=1 Tax=Corynebacterium sp. TaxID=1720 RepID=UPI0026DB53BE|nr:YdcF family protein [Corynebacterium sp.]MDO5031029.1 YdcF family protein [Corynebacterium sp.]